MRATPVFAALLLATAAVALLPSATAIEQPPQCQAIGGGCCGIEPAFAPCCSIVECPPPLVRCPQTDVDTTDFVQFLGPWATVSTGADCSAEACLQTATCCVLDGTMSRCTAIAASASSADPCPSQREPTPGVHVDVDAGCNVTIWVKMYDCVWNCGWVTYVQGPPLTVRVYQDLGPGGPPASASAIEVPNPCGPTAYCEGPSCPEKSVSTTQLFGFVGPHFGAAVHRNCTVDAWEAGLPCPSFAPDRGHVERTVGPVEADADTCVPNLDCTCPPLMASSAADIPPPVEVEWVVCVTEPCDSLRVYCNVGDRHVGLFTVSVSRSCRVTVTQDPLACEGMTYETTTVGPVTVRLASCGPGIDP